MRFKLHHYHFSIHRPEPHELGEASLFGFTRASSFTFNELRLGPIHIVWGPVLWGDLDAPSDAAHHNH